MNENGVYQRVARPYLCLCQRYFQIVAPMRRTVQSLGVELARCRIVRFMEMSKWSGPKMVYRNF